MEKKDLTGIKFKSTNEKEYVILSGYQNSEIVYEECNTEQPLLFCCDARVVNGRLIGAYFVSYTVTKKEFFDVIDKFDNEQKNDINSIASALRRKYYKIPMVFLKLVANAWIISQTW